MLDTSNRMNRGQGGGEMDRNSIVVGWIIDHRWLTGGQIQEKALEMTGEWIEPEELTRILRGIDQRVGLKVMRISEFETLYRTMDHETRVIAYI
jgi:hypothetical protein